MNESSDFNPQTTRYPRKIRRPVHFLAWVRLNKGMTIITALARPLLAAPFISSGVDALRRPEEHIEPVKNLQLEKTSVGELSDSTITLLTRVIGGVRVLAGVAMAAGKKPRLAALTLAATELPLALANNPVHLSSGEERKEHIKGLMTSVGLVGGALVAAGDRRGKPSLSWRLENRRDHKAEISALADQYELAMDAQKEKLQAKIEKAKGKAKS